MAPVSYTHLDVYKRQGPLAENWTRDKLNFTMESEVEKTYWKNALAMLKRECPQFFENRG